MRLSVTKYTLLAVFLLTLLLGVSGTIHAAPLAQQGGDATLRIINESEETICSVFISPVTSGEWGDDWLGENETILPGESRA